MWRLSGLRPANQPQRRLALAAHWLATGNFVARLEAWFTAEWLPGRLLPSLLSFLQPARDDFWSWHWSFQSPRLDKVQPLLGESRATDLAVNVILPWFWKRARVGGNQRLTELAEARFLAWPAAQDNSLLRLARQRLLGEEAARCAISAASQQGLLQIVRDFCDHSTSVCADCMFPDVVRQCQRTNNLVTDTKLSVTRTNMLITCANDGEKQLAERKIINRKRKQLTEIRVCLDLEKKGSASSV